MSSAASNESQVQSATPVLDGLRRGTADAHGRLEAALDLLSPPLARDRFVAVLQMFEAFHRAWEPRVAELIGDEALLAPRRRLEAVRSDLAALGAAPDASLRFDVGALEDAAAGWGSLYVVEGSTLGGLVIAKALKAAPWAPAEGLHYFNPHGRATAPMWRQVCEALETRAGRLDLEGVVQGARIAFALMEAAAPERLESAA